MTPPPPSSTAGSRWTRRAWLEWTLAGFAGAVSRSRAAELKPDERVLFFPSVGAAVPDGWRVDVHAWVFEPSAAPAPEPEPARTALLPGLRLTAEERRIFDDRWRWFRVDNERGKHLTLDCAGRPFRIGPTAADGHVRAQLTLPADAVGPAERVNDRWLDYRVAGTGVEGRSHLLSTTGVSVVSDIDDTVKISDVTHRAELLRNTFCRPFQPVPGMAELYRGWRDVHRASFHYLSGSPWALYPALAEFSRRFGFPEGSYHLRDFRIKDRSGLNLIKSPRAFKRQVLETLLRRFPSRRFVLVGDSGEHDPEVYGALAQKSPDQVIQILIRSVPGGGKAEEGKQRYADAFRGVARDRWQVFRVPSEIRGWTDPRPAAPPR